MNGFGGALWAEGRKLHRSKISSLSLTVAVLIPTVIAFFMKVLIDPSWAVRFNLLTAKANATGVRGDWSGYFSMLTQAIAVGGLGLFGILATWMFGREFSDHTMKDLLALPVRRSTIVTAKFITIAAWSVSLTITVYVLALGLGALLDLPGWEPGLVAEDSARFFAVATLTIGLTAPFGLAATIGRGYLPAVGAMFAVVVTSQILAALGLGAWFPWAVPALLSGAAGPGTAELPPASILAAAASVVAACTMTGIWLSTADQT